MAEEGVAVERLGSGNELNQEQDRLSLGDALFTSTQQRVLALLFGQPDRSFYASELIALAESGSGAVQRELRRMEQSGMVTVRRIGSQRHYQANPDSPIFSELCSIVMKTFGVADRLRQALQPLAPLLSWVFIYGSVAKSQAHAGSDIDLLVVADDLALEQLFGVLTPVESALGRRISPTLYNAAEFRQRLQSVNPFLTKVLAGPVITVMGSRNAIEGT